MDPVRSLPSAVKSLPLRFLHQAEIAADQRASNVVRSGDADQPGGCGARARARDQDRQEAGARGAKWRKLLASIAATTLRDLRDRALIATLSYSVARINAGPSR